MADTKAPAPEPADEAATTPVPDAAPAAPATAEPAAPAAPAPAVATATPAKSPWPILIPVLVGVGALLIGGVIGGAAGFGLGSRLGHGPHIELQLPGDQRGGPLQNGPFDGDRGDRGPDGDQPRLERGGTPTGDVVPLPGVAEQG